MDDSIPKNCLAHSGHECRLNDLEKETDSIKSKLDRMTLILIVMAVEGGCTLGGMGVLM